jgi:hypothetical protein
MKKCVILGCMVISFINAMENNDVSFMYNGTAIIVTRDSIGKRDKKVHAIIVGRNAQEKLQKDGKWINVLFRIQDRDHLYVKNKAENTCDNKEGKPYTSADNEQWRKSFPQIMQSKVITIAEPCIRNITTHSYNEKEQMFLPQKYLYTGKKENADFEMRGEIALEEALKDLYMCYKIVLREVFKKLSGKENKKIACLPLGIHVGFPLQQAAGITAKALSDFIQDNNKAYDSIVFCVENQDEFNVYINEVKNLMLV